MVRAFVYLASIPGVASAWQHSRAGCQRGRVVLKAEEKPWVPPTPADWQEDAAALGSTPSWLASAAAPPAKAVEAVAAPTAEAWRQTCDSDGVVSYYDYGVRVGGAAAAPAAAPAADGFEVTMSGLKFKDEVRFSFSLDAIDASPNAGRRHGRDTRERKCGQGPIHGLARGLGLQVRL